METRQELIDYIVSLNRDGNYSYDDLMKIGRLMDTLPRKEKSWVWLHGYLGIKDLTPDEYRLRVKRFEWRFPIGKDETPESIQYREDYSTKCKAREWYNAYRRSIRDEERIESLKDEIVNVVDKLKALPPIDVPKKENKSDKEAVLLLSDWHIGQESDNFYNVYNREIARNRISSLADKVSEYCKALFIGKLHVLNLGDMIEGIINLTARIEQTMDIVEQIMTASEYLSQFLHVLDGLGIDIDYRSCTDNHSRAIADKKQHIEKENFNFLITWYVKERLKGSRIKFVDDNLDKGLGKFKLDTTGKTLMFMHGHNDSKSSMLQNVVGATHEWVDYVCCGHYHNPATHTFQDMRVFVNGSLCGTGPYALNRRLFTSPSQKLIVFSGEDVADIDILLKN